MKADNAKKIKKERADVVVSKLEGVPSRERAKALIMAGKVLADETKITKAGEKIPYDSKIRILGEDHPYVSRGGLKLEKALKSFGLNPEGLTALDVGASTGGFTDCLLKHGAKKVIALDVGKNLIDYNLRVDERVRVVENLNARYLKYDDIGENVDCVVIDVAFISLELVLPPLLEIIKDEGWIVALVKPQFEVGKNEVEKGGIIRSKEKHIAVIEKIIKTGIENNLTPTGLTISPIHGGKGNKEYLLLLIPGGNKAVNRIDSSEILRVVDEPVDSR